MEIAILKLLEKRFNSSDLNMKTNFDNINSKLASLEENQKIFSTDFILLREKMHNLTLVNTRHYDDCLVRKEDIPSIEKEILKIKESRLADKEKNDAEMIPIRFFLHNPPVFFGTVAICVSLFLGGLYLTYNSLTIAGQSNKMEIRELKQETKIINEKVEPLYNKERDSILK